MQTLDLVPGVRIGPVQLGATVHRDGSLLKWLRTEPDAAGELSVFGFEDEQNNPTLIYVEGSRIQWVSCQRECIYQGLNLIGLPTSAARAMFANQSCEVENEPSALGEYTVFRYSGAGVTLWALGGVVTIVDVNELLG